MRCSSTLRTKCSSRCANGAGSSIPLLEAPRDSCAHGIRIANVSTSFAATCVFVPSRLRCRRSNTQQHWLIPDLPDLETKRLGCLVRRNEFKIRAVGCYQSRPMRSRCQSDQYIEMKVPQFFGRETSVLAHLAQKLTGVQPVLFGRD